MNPSQKMPTFHRGQALPADALNHVVAAVKRMIQQGKGIHIERAGDQIVIHAKGGPIPTGGGAAAEDLWRYDDTFAGLPAPDAINLFGRVTDGADKGMTCVVNEDADGWVPFTHFG